MPRAAVATPYTHPIAGFDPLIERSAIVGHFFARGELDGAEGIDSESI
jgi:hypothetical protein